MDARRGFFSFFSDFFSRVDSGTAPVMDAERIFFCFFSTTLDTGSEELRVVLDVGFFSFFSVTSVILILVIEALDDFEDFLGDFEDALGDFGDALRSFFSFLVLDDRFFFFSDFGDSQRLSLVTREDVSDPKLEMGDSEGILEEERDRLLSFRL
jgi:hypothetical protein